MSSVEKAELIESLNRDVDRIAVAGILLQHPGAGPLKVRHELARRRFGDQLADAAFGDSAER